MVGWCCSVSAGDGVDLPGGDGSSVHPDNGAQARVEVVQTDYPDLVPYGASYRPMGIRRLSRSIISFYKSNNPLCVNPNVVQTSSSIVVVTYKV